MTTLAFLFDRSFARRDAFAAECGRLDVETGPSARKMYRAGEETHLKTKRKRVSRKRNSGYDFSSGAFAPKSAPIVAER